MDLHSICVRYSPISYCLAFRFVDKRANKKFWSRCWRSERQLLCTTSILRFIVHWFHSLELRVRHGLSLKIVQISFLCWKVKVKRFDGDELSTRFKWNLWTDRKRFVSTENCVKMTNEIALCRIFLNVKVADNQHVQSLINPQILFWLHFSIISCC